MMGDIVLLLFGLFFFIVGLSYLKKPSNKNRIKRLIGLVGLLVILYVYIQSFIVIKKPLYEECKDEILVPEILVNSKRNYRDYLHFEKGINFGVYNFIGFYMEDGFHPIRCKSRIISWPEERNGEIMLSKGDIKWEFKFYISKFELYDENKENKIFSRTSLQIESKIKKRGIEQSSSGGISFFNWAYIKRRSPINSQIFKQNKLSLNYMYDFPVYFITAIIVIPDDAKMIKTKKCFEFLKCVIKQSKNVYDENLEYSDLSKGSLYNNYINRPGFIGVVEEYGIGVIAILLGCILIAFNFKRFFPVLFIGIILNIFVIIFYDKYKLNCSFDLINNKNISLAERLLAVRRASHNYFFRDTMEKKAKELLEKGNFPNPLKAALKRLSKL